MIHITRAHRALMGVLAAGVLALPAVQAMAAPKKPAKKPAKPAATKPDAKLGKSLYTKEGCSSCHKAGDIKGGEMGPDLTGIGSKQTAAQLDKKIMHPGASSIMPALKDAKKSAHITAFLLTLK
jgi:mono/diheme cytochrome c family protein